MIDWDHIISSLTNGSNVTVDPKRWKMSNPEYQQMLDLWEDSNFNTNSVKWTNYYSYGNIESQIASKLAITPLRSWISCVEPGYMTGYHYDIDDKEKEYLTHGEIKRYSIFISKPTVGHLFILKDQYYHGLAQGTVVKWDSHRDWHNGINGGFANKYMFHILGY